MKFHMRNSINNRQQMIFQGQGVTIPCLDASILSSLVGNKGYHASIVYYELILSMRAKDRVSAIHSAQQEGQFRRCPGKWDKYHPTQRLDCSVIIPDPTTPTWNLEWTQKIPPHTLTNQVNVSSQQVRRGQYTWPINGKCNIRPSLSHITFIFYATLTV